MIGPYTSHAERRYHYVVDFATSDLLIIEAKVVTMEDLSCQPDCAQRTVSHRGYRLRTAAL
jgi:hypothetical protein